MFFSVIKDTEFIWIFQLTVIKKRPFLKRSFFDYCYSGICAYLPLCGG